MPPSIRFTVAVAKVVSALLEAPDADRYGLDLIRTTGLPSGTVYPILERLQRAGWLTAHWEPIDPGMAGRPARRYYRLTAEGVVAVRTELAELHRQLGGGHRPAGEPRPA